MKSTLRLALLIGAAFSATAANAQQPEGNWMVRFRAVDLRPANESSGLGGNNALHVEDKWIPEVDFSYFITRNIAAELILTVPQQHDVKLNGTNIGSFKHLPPTLTLQYHFAPDATFRPYVGAGVNYTIISDDHLVGGAAKLDNDSWGGALQAGFDYKIGPNSYLNFDVKKVYIKSDVKVAGAKVAEVKVDPVLVGIGWGFKF